MRCERWKGRRVRSERWSGVRGGRGGKGEGVRKERWEGRRVRSEGWEGKRVRAVKGGG